MSLAVIGILFAALAGLADAMGGYLAEGILTRLGGRALVNLMALGAGFLLGVALLDLVPDVIKEDPNGPLLIVLGYFAIYVAENLFSAHAHAPVGEEELPLGEHTHALVESPRSQEPRISGAALLSAFLGLSTHAFFDGVVVVAGFTESIATGVLVFFAILAHKIPEGFSITAIAMSAQLGSFRAVLLAVLVGIFNIVGGAAVILAGLTGEGFSAVLLALAAGTFIYIGATDLIPATHARQPRRAVLYTILGLFIYYVSRLVVEILIKS